MTKCLFDRHLAEPLFRGVQERASRSGQDEPAGGGYFADQRLEDSRMFRIDRQDGRAVPVGGFDDLLAGYHEALLVGEGEFFARLYRSERRHHTGISYQGIHHDVGAVAPDDLFDGLRTGIDLDGQMGEGFPHVAVPPFVGDDYRIGSELLCLPGELLPIAACGENRNFEPVAAGTYDVERLFAYRTRRAQQCYPLLHGRAIGISHISPGLPGGRRPTARR